MIYNLKEYIMRPEVSISKWGNSQGLRIPKSIVEALQINIGDKVKIFIDNGRAVIEPVKKRKKVDIDTLIADIPKDYKKDEELLTTPMGKEVW
ncbi:MAG: Transcriptional regulator/antitoxin MazE [uncultured Sulfurovum sp.]|uniref:Transcriptional regulator/antitoxin MazE n=1 Tax=uncultured Sulfurovum sp. TaxID=269237 RepID=A0A6S6TYT1_9BACT|nr:MAG: Transcriptional regulator/antitoxin MazE [uncultured Sulfurovum sp.]